MIGWRGRRAEAPLPPPELSLRHRQHALILHRQDVASVVEKHTSLEIIAAQRREAHHPPSRRPSRRAGRPHLDVPRAGAERHHQVDLLAILVAEVPSAFLTLPTSRTSLSTMPRTYCRCHWRARAGLRARGSG